MASDVQVRVMFSPNGGAAQFLVEQIDAAKESIWVATYDFTSRYLVRALVAAQERGVAVAVVLDGLIRPEETATISHLRAGGCDVYLDDAHASMHNKYAVFDARTVVTGSYNWTDRAERRNSENLLALRGLPNVIHGYMADFASHVAHSKSVASIGQPAPNPSLN